MLAMLSDTSIIVIVVLVLVLFGGSQLPKLAKNLGTAGKEFRKAQAEAEAGGSTDADRRATPATPAAPPAVTTGDDDRITLSKAELDALLTEREERARRASGAS